VSSATETRLPRKAARPAPAPPADARPKFIYHRHSALVRATHWINVACIALLLLSGMAIFNAHPALYLGDQSDFANPFLNLGVSSPDAKVVSHPFPDWLVGGLGLANGRRWHLFVAWVFVLNGAVYLIASLLDEHIWHDLLPHRWQLKAKSVAETIRHHLTLRFPHQHDYNVLQKFVYLGMIFVVLPGILVTGLAMSPGVDAIAPWLGELLGGRQTARTLHFVFATLIVMFIIVHVTLVVLSGFWNNIRSMITGEYEVDPEPEEEEETADGRP
jgi:thiosulfate reductase cytochrome b subunit